MGKIEEVEDGVNVTDDSGQEKVPPPLEKEETPPGVQQEQEASKDYPEGDAKDLLGDDDDDDSESPPLIFADKLPVVGGITKQIIKEGEGTTPEKHSTCFVHYRGWLAETSQKFHDTWQEKAPLELILGQEKPELRGLALAVGSMKGRERSLFHVAWELGYGREGNFSFPHVPPMAELIYEVQLIGFEPAKEAGVPRSMMTVEERIRAADNRKTEGNAFFKVDNYKDAMQQYEMALGYMNEDFMMQMFGKYRDLANAVRLPCLLNMAACHLKLENYHDAITSCNEVLAEEEKNTKALFRRGKARAALGQTPSALEDLKRANQLNPGDKAVLKELRSLAEQEKEIQDKQKELYKGMFVAAPSKNDEEGEEKEEEEVKVDEESRAKAWYLRLWAFLLSFFLMIWPFRKRRVKLE